MLDGIGRCDLVPEAVGGEDDKVVLCERERTLGGVGYGRHKVGVSHRALVLLVTDGAADGEVAVDATRHDHAAGLDDALLLLGYRGLVNLGERDGHGVAAGRGRALREYHEAVAEIGGVERRVNDDGGGDRGAGVPAVSLRRLDDGAVETQQTGDEGLLDVALCKVRRLAHAAVQLVATQARGLVAAVAVVDAVEGEAMCVAEQRHLGVQDIDTGPRVFHGGACALDRLARALGRQCRTGRGTEQRLGAVDPRVASVIRGLGAYAFDDRCVGAV